MTQCQFTHPTGDQCTHNAHQQLCGVWFCHDHLELTVCQDGLVARMYRIGKDKLAYPLTKDSPL